MSVEHQIPERITTIRKIKPLSFKREIPPLMGGMIERWSETIGIATEIDYRPGFTDQYVDAIKNNYFPVVIGNHDSQANAIALAKLAFILTGAANEVLPEDKRLEGFLLPLAKSLDAGKQGKWAKLAYDGTKPVLEKYHLIPVLTATKNDVNQRGINRNTSEFMHDMKRGIEEGYAIAVLPEGTVEGGRKGPDGKRLGMQPFVDISLETCIILARRYKKQPTLFIPVGLEGGTQIHDPQTKLPHMNALLAGLGFGDARIAKIHVGLPIKSDGRELHELVKYHNWQDVNNFVGRAVADLIPEEMRGVYA